HAHHNVDDHHHETAFKIPLYSIVLGLSLHAFMEGLPLGFHYRIEATQSSLYLAVGAHKLPEAMLVTSLVFGLKGKKKAVIMLFFFSLITPVASMLAEVLGTRYFMMRKSV